VKVQVISDIHLEFGMRDFDFSDCDLLVLAGDIHVGTKGFDWILETIKDKPVIYVLGNHEYYKNSYPKLLVKLKDLSSGTNIHILENESIELEDITFHCMTLWTDFNLFGKPEIAAYESQTRMNDYKVILRDPSYSKMRSIDTLALHNESIKWLKDSLQASKTAKNVVVSHHAPSNKSIEEKYSNDLLSAAFASNLDDIILEHQPDYWFHGHVHEAFDYTIGKTRVICNSCGYPFENPERYIEKLIIEM